MENQKPLEFNATAGSFFLLFVISLVFTYIPLFGWAYLINYGGAWAADHTFVNGRKVVFRAGYGETLGFMVINLLLLIVTLGIYMFWFYPKFYSYIAAHVAYADASINTGAFVPNPVAAPVMPQVTSSIVPAAQNVTAPTQPSVTQPVASDVSSANPGSSTTPLTNPIV